MINVPHFFKCLPTWNNLSLQRCQRSWEMVFSVVSETLEVLVYLKSAALSLESPNWHNYKSKILTKWECLFRSKNYAWCRYWKKALNGRKKTTHNLSPTERPKTPFIVRKVLLLLLYFFRPIGRKVVGCSFSFSLSAMQPFVGQTQRRKLSFYYEIATSTKLHAFVFYLTLNLAYEWFEWCAFDVGFFVVVG